MRIGCVEAEAQTALHGQMAAVSSGLWLTSPAQMSRLANKRAGTRQFTAASDLPEKLCGVPMSMLPASFAGRVKPELEPRRLTFDQGGVRLTWLPMSMLASTSLKS